MRAQVISTSEGNIVVCLGLDDGAEEGQELTAYRFFETNDKTEEEDIYKKEV